MKLAEGTFQGLEGSEVALFKKILAGVGGIGVEIGCLDGYSSSVILDASNLHLTSIDPFIPDSMEASLRGQEARYRENVAPFAGRHALVKDYSWNARRVWEKPLDFLFIDGDHKHHAVLQDYNDWTPLLSTGGILAIHDSRMSRPGGAKFHVGPSQVAAAMVYGQPDKWSIVGEAFSLTVARKL